MKNHLEKTEFGKVVDVKRQGGEILGAYRYKRKFTTFELVI